jgi:DNA-3-methyladenine glycosylase II
MAVFTIQPSGPFSLAAAQSFAGGFAAGIGAHGTADGLSMTFPVEGWAGSVVVDAWQVDGGPLEATIAGSTGDVDTATVRTQAARSLSLDHDGQGWPEVGRRDPVIGRLQGEYGMLLPVCFYSAYEAATSFVIGQRISMTQTRRIKDGLADRHGDRVRLTDLREVAVFPRPQQLVDLTDVPGLAAVKVDRLRELARAALDGRLDTQRLRGLPEAEALAALESLPGVGPWTAQGILMRGCGTADTLPLGDGISRGAVQALYARPEPLDDDAWTTIAEAWRPYRMWATVLLHMAWRRQQPATPSYRQGA